MIKQFCPAFLYAVATTAIGLSCVGCAEKKEKVLEVDAPGVDIEINRDADSGEVDVTVGNSE